MSQLTADQLVERAELFKVGRPRQMGYEDDKAACTIDELFTLLHADGRIIRLNETSGKAFYSLILHRDYTFVANYRTPISRTNV